MTALTHPQARQCILAATDGLLASVDQELLIKHLQTCSECQRYQAELNVLEAQIQTACQEHRETAPSLQRTLVPNLQTQHRRNAMNARLASTLKFAIRSALLAVLVILVVTSLLNAKKIQGKPTPQPAQQTPVLDAKSTPTLETNIHPEIDLSTGKQNGEWIAMITSIDENRSDLNQMDVYLIHPNGSGLINLTNFPAFYFNLQWSPDGKNLTFLRKYGDKVELIRKSLNGSGEIAIFDIDSEHSQYSWSPNNTQIAFLDHHAGNYDIYTLFADGRNDIQSRQLTKDPTQDAGFVWSPDGNQIAYLSYETTINEGKFSVHVMNADGSNNVEVAQGSGQVKLLWAADGKSIYATAEFGQSWLDCAGCLTTPSIYLISTDGGPVQQVFRGRDSTGGEGGIGPTLSGLFIGPENMIYFRRDTFALHPDRVSWMRTDGKTVQEIGALEARTICPSSAGQWEEYTSTNKMYSLVSVPCAGKFNLYLADRHTASPEKFLRPLVTLPDGTKSLGGDLTWIPTIWSPDGRWVVIQTEGTGEYGTIVQTLNIDAAMQDPTTQPGPLLQSKSMLAEIVWQPKAMEEPNSSTPVDRLAAFASSQDGNSEIYVTRTDGGGAVNLTSNAAYDGNPIWSPDGKQLAFESERDGNREIYVMNLDGSDVRRLTNDPASDVLTTSQAWSLDGKHLLYRNDQHGKWDLFVAQINGSGVVQLTQDSDPAVDGLFYWSPDGKKVAYEVGWATKNKPQVYVINADGANRQQLPTPQVAFGFSLYNWSTDGQALYYSASDCEPNKYGDCAGPRTSLYQVALDGSDPVLLASAPEVLNWIISPGGILYFDVNMPPMSTNRIGYDHWIWWQAENGGPKKLNEWPNLQEKCQTPDIDNFQVARSIYTDGLGAKKKMLVAAYCGKDNQSWLYLVNADGSRIQPLNNAPLPGRADNLRISNDEQQALLDIFDDSGKATYALNLVAAQNDPTLSPIRLTGDDLRMQPIPFNGLPSPRPAPTPTASPVFQNPPTSSQQDLIVFAHDGELFIMQKDGKALRQLTKGQLIYTYEPLWSPNGKQITFGGQDKNDNYGQYLINLDGSEFTRLTDGGWKTIWSPDGSQLATMFGDVQKPADGKIEIVNVEDDSQRRTIQLENIIGEPDPGNPMIQWSSDGKFIQFLAVRFSGGIPYSSTDQWTIYQANVQDGSLEILVESKVPIASWYGTATDLTYMTADESKNVWQWIHNQTVQETRNQSIFDPAFNCRWSPNHRQLVCTMREGIGKESFQLLLINADDFSIKSITQGVTLNANRIEPSWSPDGRYLVFHSSLESPGNNDIYRLDVQAVLNDPATKPVRLTNSGFNETQPDWQP